MFGLVLLMVCTEPAPDYVVVKKEYVVVNRLPATYVVVNLLPKSPSITITESHLTVDTKQQTYTLSVTQSGGCVGGVCYPTSRPGLFQRLRR